MTRRNRGNCWDDVEAFLPGRAAGRRIVLRGTTDTTDQVIPAGEKSTTSLGMESCRRRWAAAGPISVTYALGPGPPSAAKAPAGGTFFSGHTSNRRVPDPRLGQPTRLKKALSAQPRAAGAKMILAFGLNRTGGRQQTRWRCNPPYERRGDKFVLNGVKYLISKRAGDRPDAVVVFA